MQVTELRIGNLVYNQHEEIHEIGFNCFQRFRTPSMDGNPSGFKPIPLTEEILLKCGFVKDDSDEDNEWLNLDWRHHKFRADQSTTFNEVFVYPANPAAIIYLHQLQNLYFALTGEELEYTP